MWVHTADGDTDAGKSGNKVRIMSAGRWCERCGLREWPVSGRVPPQKPTQTTDNDSKDEEEDGDDESWGRWGL